MTTTSRRACALLAITSLASPAHAVELKHRGGSSSAAFGIVAAGGVGVLGWVFSGRKIK